uniref:SD10285p n=1 Tax=Drosophila melanogaster TaxID=7227 RepID=C7LAE0_DROME|nr:SD10285p [Drosophila melanogaster]
MCLSDSPLDDELISKTWEFFILGDFSAQTLDSIIEYTIYIVLISKVRQPSKTRTYISHSLQIQYSNKPFTLQWGNQISMQTTS